LSLLLGGLLFTAVSFAIAQGGRAELSEAQKRAAHRPYVAAATDCLARAVAETPQALQRAHEGLWREAVSITGHHCDPVLGRMLFAHGQLYGSQGEQAPFREAYAADLPQVLAVRLRPVLENVAADANSPTREQVARVVPSSY